MDNLVKEVLEHGREAKYKALWVTENFCRTNPIWEGLDENQKLFFLFFIQEVAFTLARGSRYFVLKSDDLLRDDADVDTGFLNSKLLEEIKTYFGFTKIDTEGSKFIFS
ncbi:hypothetical protein [Membranihabitans maritimus]|uniref:hypothetical protein n=1 Tax=Membranihabitans maritimus TaxID=2904244 RepID=UPI001F2E735F|nr:hypothetical protein [Membranihabitans maritimus]